MPKKCHFPNTSSTTGCIQSNTVNQLYNQTAEMLSDFAAKKLLGPIYFHISVPGSISIIDC